MWRQVLLASVLTTLLPIVTALARTPDSANWDYHHTCLAIAASLGNTSRVAFPGTARWTSDIKHWAASSAQPSACSVEPANAAEVGTVLNIIGRSSTPFTIKSGGHAINSNFSSTPGVLIVMNRFTGVEYNKKYQTATIGVGQVWDDVYAALQPYNVTVAGGRAPGVGVGGFVAGGGYSFMTSEVGLSIDTVVSYELVKPDGTVTIVTAKSDAQLFWALKGTGNNFGVITRFTMKTFPQDVAWGGTAVILPQYIDAVIEAFSNYDATVKDPKAAMYIIFQRVIGQPGITSVVTAYYNGQTPPAGIFDELLAIPANSSDISTQTVGAILASQAFPSISGIQDEQVPINQFPLGVIKAYLTEVERVALLLANTSATSVAAIMEGFQRDLLLRTPPLKGFHTPSAWPPTRKFPTFPNGFFVAYEKDEDALAAARAVNAASDHIREVAATFGALDTAMNATDAAKYPNYAHWNNTAEEIYGSALPRLRKLQKIYDPRNLMKRAGGFKF